MLEITSQPKEGGKPRILFAEDDVNIGSFVTELLLDEGFDVTAVESGDQAASILDQESFHLLLTDVQMPGVKDGLDLVSYALRQKPRLPIVIVSGYSEGLAGRIKEVGRKVAFLSKPFLVRDLISTIQSELLSA